MIARLHYFQYTDNFLLLIFQRHFGFDIFDQLVSGYLTSSVEKIFDHIEKSGIFGRRNVGEFLWDLMQMSFVTILNQSHREWFEGTMIGARFAKGGEFATALQVQHFRSLGTSNVKEKKRWKTERAQAKPQVRSHSTEARLE